ncbi:MAG: toll/interleukin-1 receptor domain-containing protein [Candidatus Hermodarchaeota archaeon]
MKIFVSYAIDDLELFQISKIVAELEKYPTVENLYYWDRDSDSSQTIPEYMENSIKESDIFLVFCSELSKKSKAIAFELDTAKSLGKRIVPIFRDIEHVREDIRKYRGVELGKEDFEEFFANLYLILTGEEIPTRKPEVLEILRKIESGEMKGAKNTLSFENVKPESHNNLIAGIFERYELLKQKTHSSRTKFECFRKYLAREGSIPVQVIDYSYQSDYSKGIITVEGFSDSLEKSKRITTDLIQGIEKIHDAFLSVSEFFDACPYCGMQVSSSALKIKDGTFYGSCPECQREWAAPTQ